MNLVPRKMIFLLHIIIMTSFTLTHQAHYQMLLALLLHLLVLRYDSACYRGHCQSPVYYSQENICQQQQCKSVKWMRMRHCYKCKRCVHKYDHHCVLMDLCIGEFNHRYYLLFLGVLLWNTVVILVCFTEEIKGEVAIDEVGVESFSGRYYLYGLGLIGLYFNFILTVYLLANHLFFILYNTTTWQFLKRDGITYLKNIDPSIKYPFDKGLIRNITLIFGADPQNPTRWQDQIQATQLF